MSGYRSLQGQGFAERDAVIDLVNSGHLCPSCGHVFVGVHAPSAVPADLPKRGKDAQVMRALALEPTAERLALGLVADLTSDDGEYRGDATGDWRYFLGRLRLIDAVDGLLWLLAPPEIAEWTATRYRRTLERVASLCAGRPMSCRVVSAPAVEARTLAELADGALS